MEDVLTQLTRQFLPQMTAAEKSRALRSRKALTDAELFDLAASAEVVPRCKKQQLAIFFGNVETVLTA